MSTASRYKVSIYGDTYTLLSDESEAQVLKIAEQVHSLMQEIAAKTGGVLDHKRIAVLAALQLAGKKALLEQNAHRLEQLLDRELLANQE